MSLKSHFYFCFPIDVCLTSKISYILTSLSSADHPKNACPMHVHLKVHVLLQRCIVAAMLYSFDNYKYDAILIIKFLNFSTLNVTFSYSLLVEVVNSR